MSARRGEPFFATASAVRAWLMIEVRGAWGEDAIHASALGEHVSPRWKDELKGRGIRAVCIRSALRRDAPDVRMFTCAARRPGSGPARLWCRTVPSLHDVIPAVDGLAAGTLSGDGPPDHTWERVERPVFFICTNGRHDQCCANRGRPLVRTLWGSPWAERVWECSHIGGDRFAANLVVLPQSLYFGRVEPDSASALLRRLDDGRLDRSSFRGRSSYSIVEQAVEHFVRRELAIDGIDSVVVGAPGEDGAHLVRAGERVLHVRVGRRMVSVAEPLTCKGRGDQLVPQFTLLSLI